MSPVLSLLLLAATPVVQAEDAPPKLPNIVLVMSDDQGFGDVGYYGNDEIQTPQLDRMSREALRFDRFYATPLCGPTRATCMTGRHPNRFGIIDSNSGHLPANELTLAELLRERGYATGHFGKWHLGTLSLTELDSRRGGPQGKAFYSPPWENGFDVCFSTEAKVPTWDPMIMPRESPSTIWWDAVTEQTETMPFQTMNEPAVAYWNERGEKITDPLEGDDSRIIMDRALPFMRASVAEERPFLAVIWFHAPHKPVVAGPEYANLYRDLPPYAKNYYGSISALDEQVGRLRDELRSLEVERDTIVWFCSDNGPAGKPGAHPGSAGELSGRKADLYEGGIRVPGILEWPGHIEPGSVSSLPVSTLDILPTLLELTETAAPSDRPLDGLSIVPLLDGEWTRRPEPIPFESGEYVALIDNDHKVLSSDGGRTFALFDLAADPTESKDIKGEHRELHHECLTSIRAWRGRVSVDYRAFQSGTGRYAK